MIESSLISYKFLNNSDLSYDLYDIFLTVEGCDIYSSLNLSSIYKLVLFGLFLD